MPAKRTYKKGPKGGMGVCRCLTGLFVERGGDGCVPRVRSLGVGRFWHIDQNVLPSSACF